jgi:hypothetical protein
MSQPHSLTLSAASLVLGFVGFGCCTLLDATITTARLINDAEERDRKDAEERFAEEVRANEAQRKAEMWRRAEKQRMAEAWRAHESANRERALFADIERLRSEIPTAGADKTAKSKQLAELLIKAEHTKAATDGRIDIKKLAAEAAGHLDTAIATQPSIDLFDLMGKLKPGPEVDAAVVRACARVRPQVSADRLFDFVDLCLDRAGGDAKQLKWAGVDQDLAAYKKAE